MINTDLRINNYVLANGKTDQISEVKTFEISVYGCEDNVVLVKPIPLTDEWLLKFGFEKIKSDRPLFNGDAFNYKMNAYASEFRVYYFEYHATSESHEGWRAYIKSCSHRTETFVDQWPYLNHVHTLQNYYFALTGKELIIEKI